MKTLIATAFIATAAHGTGTLCTFENLSAPTLTDIYSTPFGLYYEPLSNYEGFNFTSSYAASGNKWWYYDLVGGPGYGGYDEGIIGDRAIFTPFGSTSSYNFRISRNEMWRLSSLEVTSAWSSMTVIIEGYRYGEGVFTYTAQIAVAQRVKLNLQSVYPGPLNNITEIKVYSTNVGANGASQIIIDNIEYALVPAPSALALIGIAGMIGVRRRR